MKLGFTTFLGIDEPLLGLRVFGTPTPVFSIPLNPPYGPANYVLQSPLHHYPNRNYNRPMQLSQHYLLEGYRGSLD